MSALLIQERQMRALGWRRELAALWLMHTKGRTPPRKRRGFE